MGKALAFDICKFRPDDELIIADKDAEACRNLVDWLGGDIQLSIVDATDRGAVTKLMSGADLAITAMHYNLNLRLLECAIKAGCHFLDLGGNDAIVESQMALNGKAKDAGILALPDCGLAPGMANVIAMHSIYGMGPVDKLEIRVGGLPQNPKPPLNYQLFFSVDGLINEYKEPCTVLEGGQIVEKAGLTGIEELYFDEVGTLEAFHTSGGAAWLPRILQGRVRELNYKTIRYPGHASIFKEMFDLGMAEEEKQDSGVSPRDVLEAQIVKHLSGEDKDIVLVRVLAEGIFNGQGIRKIYETVDTFDYANELTAMMRTTSYPTSIMGQMICDGVISVWGVMTPEMCVPGGLLLEEMKKRDILFKEFVEPIM